MLLKKTSRDRFFPRRTERGQAMLEYAIIVALVMVLVLAVAGKFLGSIGTFYVNIVKVVTLPFP